MQFSDQGEGKGCSQRLIACLSTLYLFSKIKADLMVKHAETLQPYLDIKCSVSIVENCQFFHCSVSLISFFVILV